MSQAIEGIRIEPLKLVPHERGRLMEVQRTDNPHCAAIHQVYVTQSFNGVVKAWYRHRHQTDQLAVVSGLVKLVLFDDREGSRTRGEVQEIVVGELAPKLVQIPPGVWHGFKAIGNQDAFLVHLSSRPFNPEAPDEERRPIGDPTIPYEW